VFIALVLAVTSSVAPAAEAVWPKNSARELSIFVTLLRYRIHADHCSAKVPQLMPKFAGLMEDLDNRIRGISRDLLASGEFAGTKDKPVPPAILFALTDSFEDMKHNVERQDAAASCPTTLQQFVEVDDESLKSGLTEALAAVQNMIRNLETEGAR
jgi:hypothetical protein